MLYLVRRWHWFRRLSLANKLAIFFGAPTLLILLISFVEAHWPHKPLEELPKFMAYPAVSITGEGSGDNLSGDIVVENIGRDNMYEVHVYCMGKNSRNPWPASTLPTDRMRVLWFPSIKAGSSGDPTQTVAQLCFVDRAVSQNLIDDLYLVFGFQVGEESPDFGIHSGDAEFIWENTPQEPGLRPTWHWHPLGGRHGKASPPAHACCFAPLYGLIVKDIWPTFSPSPSP